MSHAALISSILLNACLFAPADDGPDVAVSDATLNDVFFVDATHGWAVGEQGAIWKTDDSGQSWQLRPSGAVLALESVWFADEKTGWAVGGQGLPYSQASAGLVLGTGDGGQTWQPFSWQQFPRLLGVQFTRAKTGWAWGESSELFPSGLFMSENAGRMWHLATGPPRAGWLAGHFKGQDSGVLVGAGNLGGVVVDRSVRLVNVGSLGARALRSVKFSNDGTAWAVGDGSLVLRSNTLGATWSVVATGLPDKHDQIFDWRGVHAIGDSVWIVGRPGSVVLASHDAGRSWQSFPTGQSLPLESVWFNDRKRGWAVGALGTILGTEDGGRTWQVERRGGERAALVTVHGAADTAPLVAHVQLGAEQGYLTADLAMISPRADGDDSNRATTENRLSDAIRLAGGARSECEWRFPANPLAQSLRQVLDDWNRQREGKAIEDLERRLVVAIRVWRPDVIVTDSPDPAEAADPSSALVSQALARAFQSAADPAAFPELVDAARLPPWAAKKLFARTRGGSPPDVRIDGAELSRKPITAGRPIEDQATLAASLLCDKYRPADSQLTYRLVASRIAAKQSGGRSLMDDIVLEPGGPARRRLPPVAEITDADRRAVEMRRNFLAIVNRAEGQPVLARQLTGQLDTWLKQMNADQAGQLLFGLARTHFEQGRWSESRELLEKLLADYPNHMTAAEAQRWLIQFYASSEARHRERRAGAFSEIRVDPPPRLSGSVKKNQPDDDAAPKPLTDLRTVASESDVTVGGSGTKIPWNRGAVDGAKRFMQSAPLLSSDPAVQFPLAAAHRALGNSKDADRFYTTFSFGRDIGPWADAARSERWMRDRDGRPPKPVIVSVRAPVPPRLDGMLDDPVWRASTPVALQSPETADDERWDTQLRVAHDGQFLYVAVACYSSSGDAAPPLRPRTRDMDLSAQDRVEFLLDLDRDYTTYYHLAVDRRGCAAEDCWGDRTWDPQWYVASAGDEHGYRIEAAVPLAELTATPPSEGTVWAFNAVRIVPGRKVLSWSRPAGTTPRPEGMGYLFFSDSPLPPPPRAGVAN